MKIESIERTRGTLRVRMDNGECLRMTPTLVAELGIYPGQEVPDAALPSLRESCAEASAKERAVRIISAAPVTAEELRRRLVQKGESEAHARAAVAWLEGLRLLDDRQVAEQVVRSGASRGYGAARIRQMLYEKRVPKELWDEALEALPARDDAIDAFLLRRFRGRAPDRDECRRAMDALRRRGHSWDDIRRAMERYAPEEDMED